MYTKGNTLRDKVT